MFYPFHQLLQIGGYIGGDSHPVEVWTCNIRLITVAPGDTTAPIGLSVPRAQAYLTDVVRPALNTWWGSSLYVSEAAKLQFVKVNSLDNNGHYAYPTTVEYFYPDPASGAGPSTNGHPFQVSRVVSWLTDVSRGKASKGRIFLPCATGAVDEETGLTSDGASIALASATFLDALNHTSDDEEALNTRPAVVSGLILDGSRQFNYITRVRVDNKLDIQRRRANELTPTSVFHDV